MPTLQANTGIDMMNINHILPPHFKEEEEFYYPTPEEEKAIAEAEAEMERGEYYTMLPNETVEEFLNRIDADPIGTMACNNGDWERDKQLNKAMEVYEPVL